MPIVIPDGETATPCFVGFTERVPIGADGAAEPQLIDSLLAFERVFGRAHAPARTLSVARDPLAPSGYHVSDLDPTPAAVPVFQLYGAVRLYFDNGGKRAVVVSCGDFTSPPDGARLLAGLATVRDTYGNLLVVPDASTLASVDEYAAVVRAMLEQCAVATNRFAILDVWQGHHEPRTTLPTHSAASPVAVQTAPAASRAAIGNAHLNRGAAYYPFLRVPANVLASTAPADVHVSVSGAAAVSFEELQNIDASATAAVRQWLRDEERLLPPSGAVAGIYARVDIARGIWKAPANESLNDVIGTAVPLNDVDQQALNVDPAEGKSINAVRMFTGRGTLVWGARTLAGNDNEWRYVSTRRLVSTLDAQVRRATAFAVLEPQTPALWARACEAAESVLQAWWRNGALHGVTVRDAFFVRCGLGRTMTQQDLDEGRLIVEVGLAVVRPAEFIIVSIGHDRRHEHASTQVSPLVDPRV